ncbi:MAG TPA: DUF3300 domain-containing protein [Mesorhizobium sp.]|nr:DUF3300 domain-containing protein [Mesorhizobium sp.]
MIAKTTLKATLVSAIALTMMPAAWWCPGFAQEQTAPAPTAAPAPEPLSADELEVLVARIALYPDELVALISAASLYPLQIVDAARYLEAYATDKNLKPKESWDGSVVSLLNYPEVVKMMSDDLEWTQAFGDALAYQQKDVLIAIQQLREEAVAKNIIKSDDKMKVETSGDNIIIQSASSEKVYVPRYEPAMLYEPSYVAQPVGYYPNPYPSYWYPTATFFAAAATGAIWAAAVDWDDWGVWGGDWDGGDIDIDCDNCFNNRDFNGKVDLKDVDWKNIDRSKIKIDKDQLAKLDRTNIKNNLERNGDNAIRDRAQNIKKRDRATNRVPGKTAATRDVRKSTLDGLKAQGGQAANRPANRPNANRPDTRPAAANRTGGKDANVNRKAGKPKPAARADNRPKKPSGLGNVDRGKAAKVKSNRGHQSMGGGHRGGGGHKQVRRSGGAGHGGGRGGGGRGGGGRR